MGGRRTTRLVLAAALAAAVTASLPTNVEALAGHVEDQSADEGEIAAVRRATARYHRLDPAIDDGFEAFAIPDGAGAHPTDLGLPGDPTCFSNDSGGMGVHYVKGIDADLDADAPEALVYEIDSRGHSRLVGVEYIVPEEFVDPDAPPSVLGQELHHHAYLPVYILHAWVWKQNPDGVFADFNPRVGACPSEGVPATPMTGRRPWWRQIIR